MFVSSLIFLGVAADSIDSDVDRPDAEASGNRGKSIAYSARGRSAASTVVSYAQQPAAVHGMPTSGGGGRSAGGSNIGQESTWRPAPSRYANDRFTSTDWQFAGTSQRVASAPAAESGVSTAFLSSAEFLQDKRYTRLGRK